jgi:hypothetical protein
MSGARDCVHPPELVALKVKFGAMVDAVGGVDRAGEYLGRCRATISNWQNVNHDGFPPVDAVMTLARLLPADPRGMGVIAWLALKANAAVIALPVGDYSTKDYARLLSESMRESGSFHSDMVTAMSDLVLDEGERRELSDKARAVAVLLIGLATNLERGL